MLTRSRFKLGKGKLVSYKPGIQRIFHKSKMAYEGKEWEYPPMRPEEVMAILCTMGEIIDYLYQRVQKTYIESLVKGEGRGEIGGP